MALCRQRPGWFLPEEITPAAALLGLTPEAFFREWLAVDFWLDDPDVAVLAPGTDKAVGTEYPFDPLGRCALLDDDDRCRIHAAKPVECREAWHGTPPAWVMSHEAVADRWRTDEAVALVYQCLGRAPITPRAGDDDAVSFWTAELFSAVRDVSREA